jgi:hypothetical protein
MTELLPFLKLLISAPGLSGYEAPVRGLIEEAWRPITDELSVSRLGSLHGLRQCPSRPSVLIAPAWMHRHDGHYSGGDFCAHGVSGWIRVSGPAVSFTTEICQCDHSTT